MLGNFGVHSGGVFLVQSFTHRGYAPIYAQSVIVCGTGKSSFGVCGLSWGPKCGFFFLHFLKNLFLGVWSIL
jgi:hypothetical protein